MEPTAEAMLDDDKPAPMLPIEQVIAGLMGSIKKLPDEEVDAMERDDRKNDALKLLDRFPRIFRKAQRLEKTSTNERLRVAAKAWIPDRNFVVLGKTGVGKSQTVGWMLRRLVAHGVQQGGSAWEIAKQVHWFHATEIERARLEHPLGKGDAPEILMASAASVVVIDDLGQDVYPAGVSEVLVQRYDAGLPTIVTSNLTRDGLLAHYGAPVTRRLLETGGMRAALVDLTGPP